MRVRVVRREPRVDGVMGTLLVTKNDGAARSKQLRKRVEHFLGRTVPPTARDETLQCGASQGVCHSLASHGEVVGRPRSFSGGMSNGQSHD